MLTGNIIIDIFACIGIIYTMIFLFCLLAESLGSKE